MAVPNPALHAFSITRAPGAVPFRPTRPWPLLSTITTSRSALVCRERDCTHSRSLESSARVGITTLTRKPGSAGFYLVDGVAGVAVTVEQLLRGGQADRLLFMRFRFRTLISRATPAPLPGWTA